MEILLKGKEVSEAIEKDILTRITKCYENNVVPTVAIVRVGNNKSDIAYENGAIKKAKALGMQPEKYTCPGDISEEDLLEVIRVINDNEEINGTLLLQPLPKGIDGNKIRNAINTEKDIDCISDTSLGKLFIGESNVFPPCTAESCIEILKHYNIPISGKNIVVIGRSMVIGKPVSLMLMKENGTITICHTKTPHDELKKHCNNADIIVAAAGHVNTITPDMVRNEQIIIDVGINFNEEGKMIGDVDYQGISPIVKGATPVPGGVGSVTTTILMKHLLDATLKTIK